MTPIGSAWARSFLMLLLIAAPLSLWAAEGARTPQRDAANAVLQSLARALTAGDVAAVLSHYDSTNTALLAEVERDARSLLGRTALSVNYRLAEVTGSGQRIEVIALLSIGYDEHQRPQMLRNWQTFGLQRSGADWRIVAQAERDIASTERNDLDIELFPEQGTLRGAATLQVKVLTSGADSVLLELNRGLEVTALTDEQRRPVEFARTGASIEVRSPRVLRVGQRRTLHIRFAGRLFNESQEQGYSQVAITPRGSFASWVTHWYPHVSGTQSKAKGRLRYSVPAGITVASNGRLATVDTLATGQRYVFEVEHPVDFSFAAAKYQLRTTRVEGVQLGIYLLGGGDAKAELYMQQTARVLRVQRALYGFYPLDGYAVVEIPSEETGSLGGSSEQGLNFFPAGVLTDDRFPLPLVAHEMGHVWWGNLVKSRDNAMLDEGMAQLSALLCVLDFDGEAAMRRFVREGYPGYAQSAFQYFMRFATPPGRDYPLGSAPTGGDSAAALHDLADTKGLNVYSTLRDRIGQEALLKGLRTLATSFADRSITLANLQSALQVASGTNLERFFQQWFQRTGAPELKLTTTTGPSEKGYVTTGSVVQVGEPYELDVELVLASGSSKVVRTLHLQSANTPFTIATDTKPEWVVLDPQFKVLRWTPELRHFGVLKEGQVLSSMGKSAAAISRLEEFLRRAPDSLAGRARLGIAQMQEGQLRAAEANFRHVLDYFGSLQVFEPAVTLAQLSLGQVRDLMGQRTEAVAAYQRTLELPDAYQAHAAARAALTVAYQLPLRPAGPTRETLQRYVGDYANPQGIAFSISLDALDVLRLQPRSGPAILLEWIDAARFRPAGSGETVLEFSGEGAATVVTFSVGNTVMKLSRKQ